MRAQTIFFIFFFTSVAGLSQPAMPFLNGDNKILFERIEKKQTEFLDSVFISRTGIAREIINGRDYIQFYFRSQFNPILRFNETRSASVIFNGRRFEHIVLQYDTYTDQLIYTDNTLIFKDKVCQVALNNDNISSFSLFFGHDTLTFRYLRKDQDQGFNLKDGYYEVLSDGECKYIIKHVSTHYILNGKDEYSYSPASYVFIGNEYVQLGSKKKFIRLFGDLSDEIKHFIKIKKIKFHQADKMQITDILKFYESLETQIR